MAIRFSLRAFGEASDPSVLVRENFERRLPGPGEVEVALAALSLNYRDLMIVRGQYNPKLPLPAIPISDGAGIVTAIGSEVLDLKVGQRVLCNFVSTWEDGPFHARYLQQTLGTPGPGVATQYQYFSPKALVPLPPELSFCDAATLPIAALTAYSALVSVGQVQPGQKVLTLGTGGVSMFVLQLGVALGLSVAITSSSDEKLARCRELGAAHTLNYIKQKEWGKAIAQWSGEGVDVVVETGGIQTLGQSIRATKAGGKIAVLGALTGLRGAIDLAPIMMRRIALHGVMVDSKSALKRLLQLVSEHRISPVIARQFGFEELPQALQELAAGRQMGKIVVEFGPDTLPAG